MQSIRKQHLERDSFLRQLTLFLVMLMMVVRSTTHLFQRQMFTLIINVLGRSGRPRFGPVDQFGQMAFSWKDSIDKDHG